MDYADILTKLRNRDLGGTFPEIRSKATQIGDWGVSNEVENLWQTYQQMLQFMMQGMNDPQSECIRTDICQRLDFAVRCLERIERIKNHADEKYVSTRKGLKNVPSFENIVSNLEQTSAEIERTQNDELLRDNVREHEMEHLTQLHETLLLQLFNWTWTSEVWQNAETDQANRLIFSDTISSADKAVFVSAVTLSLLEFYDQQKVLFLLDCYLSDDVQISQRSLVGFILVLYFRFDEIHHSQELKDRLNVYRDAPSFIHDMYGTMMQLQMSCTTDRVSSKMRNDIMPALMKGVMNRDKKEKKTDIDTSALSQNGENPEWLDSEHMDKMMHEMAELQLDGADIYFASFSTLKGNSFFSQIPHWFYPFSTSVIASPELTNILNGKMGKLLKIIFGSSPFCEGDKYSLCFTFVQIGKIGEAAIESQINQQLPNGMDLDELSEQNELQKPKKADIRRNYIFDLYRFFHCYPYKQQFFNPFALLKQNPITPLSNRWLKKLLGNEKEELSQYADFLMRKEFYTSALELFNTIANNEFDPALASIWQKKGFCHQKLGQEEEAIHAYTVANSIKPNSKWTLSHLASLYFNKGVMEEAAGYYQELLALEPDNNKYIIQQARSLMQLSRHDEALPLLYKALYLDEESQTAKLLLSWCLFLCGKKDEAMQHVLDVQLRDMDNEEAKMQFALVMLADGNPREAYNQLHPMMNKGNWPRLTEKLNALLQQEQISKSTLTLFTDALLLNID